MNIVEYQNLQSLNTLNIPATARYFFELTEADEVPEALSFCQNKNISAVIIGAGSNIIFSQDQNALVLLINNQGITVEHSGDDVFVTAQAGENWHQLVLFCLKQGYYGLENLILIPGTAGAAPIQNIGAYGVELKQVFQSLKGWDVERECWRTMELDECEFNYRNSIFKGSLKNKFIITEVTLKLSTVENIQSDYTSLIQVLADKGITSPNANDIAQSVMDIRRSKLPDPKKFPNAGSFFKNPIVSSAKVQALSQPYPDIISYKLGDGRYKIAAGWLIEKTGWKGKRLEGVGVHDKQSLVLINYNGSSGEQLLNLAQQVSDDVLNNFGISLSIEPRIY
jgi:UDP-N-acetylmuramate dehydrogenase